MSRLGQAGADWTRPGFYSIPFIISIYCTTCLMEQILLCGKYDLLFLLMPSFLVEWIVFKYIYFNI